MSKPDSFLPMTWRPCFSPVAGLFLCAQSRLLLNSSVLPILCAGAAKCPVKAFCCYWFRPRNRSPHDLAAPLRRGLLLIRADAVHFGHGPRKRSGTDGFGHKVMCAKCRRVAAISTGVRDWKRTAACESLTNKAWHRRWRIAR